VDTKHQRLHVDAGLELLAIRSARHGRLADRTFHDERSAPKVWHNVVTTAIKDIDRVRSYFGSLSPLISRVMPIKRLAVANRMNSLTQFEEAI
jgi:hypothetical protein